MADVCAAWSALSSVGSLSAQARYAVCRLSVSGSRSKFSGSRGTRGEGVVGAATSAAPRGSPLACYRPDPTTLARGLLRSPRAPELCVGRHRNCFPIPSAEKSWPCGRTPRLQLSLFTRAPAKSSERERPTPRVDHGASPPLVASSPARAPPRASPRRRRPFPRASAPRSCPRSPTLNDLRPLSRAGEIRDPEADGWGAHRLSHRVRGLPRAQPVHSHAARGLRRRCAISSAPFTVFR